MTPSPSRGEIWWAQLPADPPGKSARPVIIVSANGRNHNERANTVLCVPLSTMLRAGAPFQLLLKSGETGMREDGMAMADNLTVIRKEWLRPPKASQRILSNTRICELANMVRMAMGCV